jgi:hypothetical protein
MCIKKSTGNNSVGFEIFSLNVKCWKKSFLKELRETFVKNVLVKKVIK